MSRGLTAPLSPRELSYLLHLRHGSQPADKPALDRFVLLGLILPKDQGFELTELGHQRLRDEGQS